MLLFVTTKNTGPRPFIIKNCNICHSFSYNHRPSPGILDNISATGCRVHFPVNVIVDLESEFDVKISLSRSPEESPLQLLCKPQWVKECKNTTQIGLKILYSPDAVRLNEFISSLQELSESPFPEIV